MKINRANLLTWHDSTEVDELPFNVQANCFFGNVAWKVGDTMSFVVNESLPLHLSQPYTLTLTDLNKTVVHTFGTVDYYTSEVMLGQFFYYTATCPAIADGFYMLKMTNTSKTIYSNPLWVMSSASNTAKFKFKHKFSKNKIEYTNTELDGFYQEFRLLCNFNNISFQSTKDILIDNDSELPREYNHKVNYLYKINFLNLSLDEHQAVHDMATCSELYINDLPMQPEGGYTADPIRRDGRSNGSLTVYDYNLRYNKRI